jgi:endonuclease/exonuclease/phosphatase family metal-dependent hydrolase
MIRIVTLNDDKKGRNSTRLHELTEPLRLAEIDVLCFQGMRRTLDGKEDVARKVAESLQMTYSFSATRHSVGSCEREKERTISGLSILTGASVWMLNSGSFSLPDEDPDRKQVAQFAVIRQNWNSILIVNVEFSPIASVQLQQLRALFSHQLFQKSYSAIVLCGNRKLSINPRKLQSVIALSAYKIAHETQAIEAAGDVSAITSESGEQSNPKSSIDGVIFTLIARKLVPAAVKNHGTPAALLLDSVLATELEFKQIPAEKTNKLLFPLSFSEQPLGPRKSNGKLPPGRREPARPGYYG